MKSIRQWFFLSILALSFASAQAQNNTWCAVMRQENYGQSYEVLAEFPAEFIEKEWKKGNYISNITFSSGKWTVVSSGLPYSYQYYSRDKNFPADWVEKKWAEGYDITEVAHGAGQWVVVMSLPKVKGQGLKSESWRKGSFQDVLKHIDEKWKQGRDVINIAYGNSEWVVTMAETPDYSEQIYRYQPSFPQAWLDENYKKGYRITSLAYGGGTWMAVMSKLRLPAKAELYWYGAEFPKSFIESNWNKNMRIVEMHYNFEQNTQEATKDHLNDGIQAANKGDHELAIYHYTEAIKVDAKNAVAYNNRAWSKYLLKQCAGALADVNQSISLDADEYNYHTRAAIYACLGRHREAIADYNRTISLAKKKEGYHYADRAKSRAALGDFQDAIADYDLALQIEPSNRDYRKEKTDLQNRISAKTPPTITWDYPSNDFYSTTKATTEIKACIQSIAGVKSVDVLVNGKTFASRGFTVNDDCTRNVNEQIKLNAGANTVEIVVVTDNGLTTRSTKKTIEYKAQSSGNYHALIIGVGDYDDIKIKDLENPEKDAERLRQTLTSKYTFNPGDVYVLKSPTKEQIIEKLIYLQDRLGDKDNLLIFYSGHGIVRNEVGYWLPKDAKQDTRGNWFSNGELRDYVNGMKTKHTLIIADACFSGSILTGSYRDVTEFACVEMEKMPSRRAMTSGASTIVPDNSVFFKYFIQNLEQNNSSCLTAEDLYSKIKPAVIYNSPNNHIPQFGVLPQAGDEGGNFIFRRKP